VSLDAQSRLVVLRQRLREAAAQIAPAAPRGSAAAADPSTALLRDVDEILGLTKALSSSIARADGADWDECDELSGRIVLRDLSLAAASLRRVLQANSEELERTSSALSKLDDALASIHDQVAEATAYLVARHDQRTKQVPKEPRLR
jgi:hypothetical protein